MMMFNWLTMWMLSSYWMSFNPETESGWSGSKVDYKTELPKVQENVDALKNGVTEDYNSAKEVLNKILIDDFCKWINWYLENKADEKQKLTTSLQAALEKHPNEKSLKNLKKALNLDVRSETAPGENISGPNFKLDWLEASQIKDKRDWESDNISKYIKTEKPDDEKWLEENVKLYQTKAKAEELSKKIVELLKNENLKVNDNLNKTNELVENINKILNNLTKDNIKLLQKFIFNNLDEDKKEQFKKDNYYNDKSDSFDGRLGKSTLWSLNDLWKKIEEYIGSFEKSNQANPESQEAENPLKDVEVKKSIDLPKWDTQIDATDLLDGTLPDGAKAEFKGKWINLEDKKPQEVTVILKIWDKTREITISATVETDSDWNKKIKLAKKEPWNQETTESTTNPLDATPYVDNQWNKYQVMGNSQTIAGKAKLNWVTFYTTEAFKGAELGNGEQWKTFEAPANGDYECFMKMWDSVYKVKVDQNWNLNPLAINYKSKAKILIKNNPSCIAYLQNKIPATSFSEQTRIAWNPSMQDYVIRSFGRGLTIEPMTLDGNWVSKDLWQCLAFENLTNFLRWNGNIHNLEFKNNNPDLKLENHELYVRIKKWAKLDNGEKSGRWFKINLFEFWLKYYPEELKKFIKYNNREDWEDDWDKKSLNKWYTKVDFPAVQVAVGGNPSADAPQASNNISQVSNNGSPSTLNKPTAEQPAVITNTTQINQWLGQTQTNEWSAINLDGANKPEPQWNEFIDFNKLSNDEKTILIQELNISDLWNFNDGDFKFKEWIEKQDGDKKYIELTLNDGMKLRIDAATDKMNWLWYIVSNVYHGKHEGKDIYWERYFYIWNFKDGLFDWKWKIYYANWDNYEWDFLESKKEWKWTYIWWKWEWKWNKYEWNWKDNNREWEWVNTYANGNILRWTWTKDVFTSWTLQIGEITYNITVEDNKYKITSEWDNKNQYIDLAKWDILGTATDSWETWVRTVTAETLDIKSLNVKQLNSKLSVALSSIPDLDPESISKIKISTEIDGSWEHVTFINGVHWVNVNIDWILSDENVFWGAKLEDRIKLLFLASWKFCNHLNKVDSISFQQNDGSNVMLLHSGNRLSYIYYSEYWLDKNTTEKFFNSYNSLISRFNKEVSNEVKLSLDKAKNLKWLIKDVDVQDKEIWIMMMLMCGKENDFISKVEASGVIDTFNAVRSDCLSQLKSKWWEAVKDIMKNYRSGEDSILHLANYITLTEGEGFVKKYNECKTQDEQLALVYNMVDQYNKTRWDVEDYIYKWEWLWDDV